MISLSPTTLLNLAQQLEARCDPIFIATELRTIVANAKPAVSPELAALMRLEIESYGQCRGAVHRGGPCDCRRCRVLAMVDSQEKPNV